MDFEIDEFVRSLYPPHLLDPPSSSDAPPPGKPFITLTYAQSLDAKISGPRNAQVILSGNESMQLTHRLRELNDSILVGVGTVLNDDPALTARIPTLVPLRAQPVPVILDPGLRTPADAKLLRNARTRIGHPPVICTTCPESDWHHKNPTLAAEAKLVQVAKEPGEQNTAALFPHRDPESVAQTSLSRQIRIGSPSRPSSTTQTRRTPSSPNRSAARSWSKAAPPSSPRSSPQQQQQATPSSCHWSTSSWLPSRPS